MDRLIQVNQGGQTRTFKHDALGRLLFERIPEQSATINDGTGTMWSCKYSYTPFHAVATKTDARGVITTHNYDTLNRLSSITYNTSGASGVASTPAVYFSYDNITGSPTEGLLTSVVVGTGSDFTESYSYDTFKRVSTVARTISSRNYTTSYLQYNTADQLTQIRYPSLRTLDINRNNAGQLTSLVNNGTSASYLSGVTYNPAGQATGWSLGSNLTETFTYDNQRLQMTAQEARMGGGSPILSLSYDYQAEQAGQFGPNTTAGNPGQLLGISGTINGAESAAFTYDVLGRLATSSQTTSGVSAQRRFQYDRWGNRTGVWNATTGGTQIQSVTLQQSGGAPTNRIATVTNNGNMVTYSYDAAGNVTWDGAHSFTYDAENRIVSVNGATAQYGYDHLNRRIRKVSGSGTVHYIWEGWQVIAEHNGVSGAVLVDYIYGGRKMIAKEQAGLSTKYLINDRLSVRMVISGGTVIAGSQGHLPFGELRSVSQKWPQGQGLGNIDRNLVFDNLFFVQVKFLSL